MMLSMDEPDAGLRNFFVEAFSIELLGLYYIFECFNIVWNMSGVLLRETYPCVAVPSFLLLSSLFKL